MVQVAAVFREELKMGVTMYVSSGEMPDISRLLLMSGHLDVCCNYEPRDKKESAARFFRSLKASKTKECKKVCLTEASRAALPAYSTAEL